MKRKQSTRVLKITAIILIFLLLIYVLFRSFYLDISYFFQLVSCHVALVTSAVPSSKSYSSQIRNSSIEVNTNISKQSIFPQVIHQMWKDKHSISSDMKSWIAGCKNINKNYEFKFYDDEELKTFVENNYPEYWEVYRSLNGVWMADMARLLIIYHHGGIYMDMDFYCHRPFSCIENLPVVQNILLDKDRSSDIMIMSLEPLMHSVILYNSTRVVIQDFFMITPKHPFIKWLLDDRNSKRNALGKKPFSYSLNKDIDRFKESNRRQLTKIKGPSIIELPSNVLHPLADSFNSEIFTRCKKLIDNPEHFDRATYLLAKPYCDKYMQHDIFNPSVETVAVHMWSHVYFRWNLLRDPFEPTVRSTVEQRLPPRQDCPVLRT